MDGLLSKISYDLLVLFERKGLIASDVRVKYLVRDFDVTISRSSFTTYNTLSAAKAHFETVVNDNRYLCSAGPLPVIENITLTNKNLNFFSEFRVLNVREKRYMQKRLKYDTNRSAFYEAEVEKYIKLINELLDQYKKDTTNAIIARLESYVDPCYVDAGYVSPNSN